LKAIESADRKAQRLLDKNRKIFHPHSSRANLLKPQLRAWMIEQAMRRQRVAAALDALGINKGVNV